MSRRRSLSKSKNATPPLMLSTMNFLSGDEKLLKVMPAAFVTSTKVTGEMLEATGKLEPLNTRIVIKRAGALNLTTALCLMESDDKPVPLLDILLRHICE